MSGKYLGFGPGGFTSTIERIIEGNVYVEDDQTLILRNVFEVDSDVNLRISADGEVLSI